MPAYLMVDVEVTDPAGYEGYKKAVEPTIAAHGGRYLVRGGQVEVLEGGWVPHRLVIVEFPSAQAARAWWSSEMYAGPKAARQACARSSVLLAHGL